MEENKVIYVDSDMDFTEEELQLILDMSRKDMETLLRTYVNLKGGQR